MIVFDKSGWLKTIFRFRGTALQRIWRRLLFTTLIALVFTYIDLDYLVDDDGRPPLDLTPLPFQLIGVALGIFLGFRNNTSYDRFWEGRKLWGAMVNTARSTTRQILTLIGPQPADFEGRLTDGHRGVYATRPSAAERVSNPDVDELLNFHRECVHRVAAYVHCVRMNLRDESGFGELKHLLPEAEIQALHHETNRPIAILQTLGERFREAWLRGWVHPQHLLALEQSLVEFTNIQGGCERIKSTPIPFSYTALIHGIVALYCYTLPFGLVSSIKWYTPLVVAIISYAFLGLDAVGDELEDPFGKDPNDLPLSTISTMIERNVRQRIGDEELPPMPKPIGNVVQ